MSTSKPPETKPIPSQAAAPASNDVTLTIDGRSVTVAKGTLIVDAATTLGIEIPVFCSHPKLDPVACCRMCLVEVVGPRGPMLQTACSVPVAPGMVVNTETEQVKATQEANLSFLLLNHPLDCPICDKGGECPLQDQTIRYGSGISQLVEPKRHKQKKHLISDTIVLDQERCVICWRCIRYLEEWEDKPQLGLFDRGGETTIDIQPGTAVDAKTSGNIIDICPVGALTNRVARFTYRPWEVDRTASICTHCSVGCNVRMDSRTHHVRRIIGRENMAVNDQWICDKGRFAHGWIDDKARLQTPLIRKNGKLEPAGWGEALDHVARRLKEIKHASGPDSIGAIGSAKLSNESNYLLQRLLRQGIGTNNIDHRDGSDVAALPTGLPAIADLMKPQYGPDPKSDVIFLFGVDPSEELPILDVHLKRAVRRGKAQLIIAHPRKIELTRYDGPSMVYRPGSEVTLLNGLTRAALEFAKEKPEGADELVGDGTPARVLDYCGVSGDTVKRAAELLAKARNAVIIYGPMVARGANGKQVLTALSNLAVAAGCSDRLSYVGLQANSQGCRDMGVLPDRLPGHVSVHDESSRRTLEKLWGGHIPTHPGKSYKQMLSGTGGSLKCLYVMGANPAGEDPATAKVLGSLDFLVVQDLYLTETAQLAEVVLPAVSWAETDGTFTNLERRVQRAPRAVVHPESKAAADWLILDHLASRLGLQWAFADAHEVTAEIARSVPLYRDLTWDALGDQGLQWDAKPLRLRHTLKRAEQVALPKAGSGAASLVTGSVLYDGGDLFSKTLQMSSMAFGASVAISALDAETMGVVTGDLLTVRTAHGEAILAARVDATVQPGTVWIPESLPNAAGAGLAGETPTESVTIKKA